MGDNELVTDGYVGDPAVQAEWDRRYAEHKQLWSGRPNGALVAEVAGHPPGRVLDVGCGEGADAVWLASSGWDVTALEVSGVALERAAAHARDAGVGVRWVHAGLAEALLPPASFDLVSAQYPALLRTPDAAAERALLEAVAPGGVLLLVHHAGMDTQQVQDSGFDPAEYVWPSMVAALFNEDWEIELNEQRPRIAPDSGAGAHHRRSGAARTPAALSPLLLPSRTASSSTNGTGFTTDRSSAIHGGCLFRLTSAGVRAQASEWGSDLASTSRVAQLQPGADATGVSLPRTASNADTVCHPESVAAGQPRTSSPGQTAQ